MVAHRRGGVDIHGVALHRDEPTYDHQLLMVLTAHDDDGRPHCTQQRVDDGRDTVEVSGTRRPAQVIGHVGHPQRARRTVGVDVVDARGVDDEGGVECRGERGELCQIVIEGARIGGEIGCDVELARVDEDADDDGRCERRGSTHQREVPDVQRPHRRDERDRLYTRTRRVERGLERHPVVTSDERPAHVSAPDGPVDGSASSSARVAAASGSSAGRTASSTARDSAR